MRDNYFLPRLIMVSIVANTSKHMPAIKAITVTKISSLEFKCIIPDASDIRPTIPQVTPKANGPNLRFILTHFLKATNLFYKTFNNKWLKEEAQKVKSGGYMM
jgi:hypothetical protein